MLWESIFWGQGEIINWETTQAQNGCVQCLQMTNISAQVPRDLIASRRRYMQCPGCGYIYNSGSCNS